MIKLKSLLNEIVAKTWFDIQNEQDPDGTHHDLRLVCTKCKNIVTCRCNKPKREFKGICHECAGIDAWGNKINEDVMDTPPAIVQQGTNTHVQSGLNEKDIKTAYLLATTIWMEGREDGEKGMHAIMNVILNRANNDISKASEVVIQPKQFSCWNSITNPIEYSIKMAQRHGSDKSPDGLMYNKAIQLVDLAFKHKLEDITHGSKYYFNPKKANPSWKDKMIKTVTIGHHEFYKIPTIVKKKKLSMVKKK